MATLIWEHTNSHTLLCLMKVCGLKESRVWCLVMVLVDDCTKRNSGVGKGSGEVGGTREGRSRGVRCRRVGREWRGRGNRRRE